MPHIGWKQKPERPSLPFLHILILIFMRSESPFTTLIPFFSSDDLNMKNLKSTNSRSCVSQFDLEPHSRLQPRQTYGSKQVGDAFIREFWCFSFFSSLSSVWHQPAHAICLLLKSELQGVLPAFQLVLDGLHNPVPAHASLYCSASCWLLLTAQPRSVAQR